MKLFAIYFPQFYQIELNSKHWGRGFTDWVRVKKSEPQYIGHNMPRIPLNNNYYDQSEYLTIQKQITAAINHNISGFDFYHYWFDGDLVLEKPIEIFSSIEHSLEFCITWANETWTKQWDNSTEVIIEQTHKHDKKIWTKHLEYLLKYFKHSNYLKIDGKPVFKIYRPELIKNIQIMISYYDNYVEKNSNFSGIYWMSTTSYEYFGRETIESNFHNSMLFQPRFLFNEIFFKKNILFKDIEGILRLLPDNLQKYLNVLNFIFKKQKTVVYSDLISKQKQILLKYPEYYHSLCVDWDNTPRYGNRFTGITRFRIKEFEEILYFFKKNYKQQILFINAWNEWAESAYLEPDQTHKYEKLEAIKKIFSK